MLQMLIRYKLHILDREASLEPTGCEGLLPELVDRVTTLLFI